MFISLNDWNSKIRIHRKPFLERVSWIHLLEQSHDPFSWNEMILLKLSVCLSELQKSETSCLLKNSNNDSNQNSIFFQSWSYWYPQYSPIETTNEVFHSFPALSFQAFPMDSFLRLEAVAQSSSTSSRRYHLIKLRSFMSHHHPTASPIQRILKNVLDCVLNDSVLTWHLNRGQYRFGPRLHLHDHFSILHDDHELHEWQASGQSVFSLITIIN
jgi:hypothetical protein